MAINLEGIVTWLKGWFYDKTEITGFLNNKANQSDLNTTNGNVTSLQSNKADKLGGVQQISDSNAHSHISTIANSTQGEINTAIDTAIGNLQSIKAIEVVSDKGIATADKLGKLFIVSENNKVNVYYVKQTGSGSSATYVWEKMDTNILDELVINWSDVQNNPFSSSTPSSFANATHNHNATEVTDSNAHLYIGSAINSTQSAINTLIDSKFEDYWERMGELQVYYIDQSDLPNGQSEYGYVELYLVHYTEPVSPYNSEWRIYYWPDGAFGNLEYVSLAQKSDLISSIYLVPKSTDANGKIIFYTGDEPT